MFIVNLTYKVDLSKVDKHLEEHIAFLDKYYSNGTFLLSGRKIPRDGGIIFAQAENKKALEAIMQEDPFFKEELINLDIIEFIPSKAAEGYEAFIPAT